MRTIFEAVYYLQQRPVVVILDTITLIHCSREVNLIKQNKQWKHNPAGRVSLYGFTLSQLPFQEYPFQKETLKWFSCETFYMQNPSKKTKVPM